ncbi:MAG: biosynthetic-type acetolactate synthase large subunit [Pseudomonadota bacterium]
MKQDDVTYKSPSTPGGATLLDLDPSDRDFALRGAQLLAASLIAEGVEVVFGYPGGANLELFDALAEYEIRVIRTEHEQGAVHAAQGYARVSGRPGVCLATSGPGATNLVTGIADANSDSTPLVCITGNVPSHLMGKNAFQEVDIVSITGPITKKNYLIKQVSDVPATVREAFALASGNRPGPVLIDIPKDIQQHYPVDRGGRYLSPSIPAMSNGPEPRISGLDRTQLKEACDLLNNANRPVIYAGGGIVSAGCSAELFSLATRLNCPVTTTVMAHGAFPPDHRLSFGCLGMHGSKFANVAVNEADVVLAIGVRFDDRVTGRVDNFMEFAKIIHIDIDPQELNKNKTVTLAVCADLKCALPQLLSDVIPGEHTGWVDYLHTVKAKYPYDIPHTDSISPQFAIKLLSDITQGDATVAMGVGQHQMWAMQHYQSRRPGAFLSSSGFGTMGYGLPAAIGAKVAEPERCVIDIDGDGSFDMNVQELATCRRYCIGVKIVIINNQWLGMVRQWQDMIYEGRRTGSATDDPMSVKSAPEPGTYPDFPMIAAGYRIKAEQVTRVDHLRDAYMRMLADPTEPYLLDVVVASEENVFPMIPAGGSYKEIIMNEAEMKAFEDASQGSNI